MDVSRRRAGTKTSVAAGSVWESRMKLDEMKGGIRVFNGEEEVGDGPRKLVKKGQISGIAVAASGKRKTWKSESFDGPIQIAKGKNEGTSIKNCDDKSRELSVSADGIKKNPIQSRTGRSEGGKELTVSVDGIDRSPTQVNQGKSEGSKEFGFSVDGGLKSPIQVKKGRSEANKEIGVSADGNEKNPRKPRSDINDVVESSTQLRKPKSDSAEVPTHTGKDVAVENGGERNSVQSSKAKSESDKVMDESLQGNDESVDEIEKNPPEIDEAESEKSCKEFGVCREKVSSSSETNGSMIKSLNQLLLNNHEDDAVVTGGDEEFEGDEEEETDEEIEKKSFDIKQINITEEKAPKKLEISISEEQKPKKVVNEVKKIHQNRTAPISSTVNKQPPPVIRRATLYQNLSKPTPTPAANQYQRFPETQNKLQNLVDLVMWKDISRSAFVFGLGTFIIISSSYTRDLNVSFIALISYLGLVYLAAIFLYRSLICREVVYIEDDTGYVVGEDEAIWLLKLVLPYLNECLLKIRALFSGDPAITMKMAVVLFALARCGSSITIWKMSKLGFFGVFTVPKICSLYSTQLTAYAKFWIRRVGDAWESCSHKKAVALAIFTLVWKLSSTVARIWAVFVMFVAVRCYQQSMESDDWAEDDVGCDETRRADTGGLDHGSGPTIVGLNKNKKLY